MAGKNTLVDVCSNRWHHRLILVQVVINYRYKWGTDIVLVLTRAFQLSTDTNTVDWWYSSVRPVRGPVARKFTGSTWIYGQHVDLRVARKSTTSPLPGPEDYSAVRVPAGYVQHGLPVYYGLIDQALSIHYRFYGAGEGARVTYLFVPTCSRFCPGISCAAGIVRFLPRRSRWGYFDWHQKYGLQVFKVYLF